MRAIVVTEFGGPEVLNAHRHEDPRPGPGEIVVDSRQRDQLQGRLRAQRRLPQALPYVPGARARAGSSRSARE